MKLEVLSPVAASESEEQQAVRVAPRLKDLRGKRIGLYWNIKAGGDTALARVQERLSSLYPNTEYHHYIGDLGAGMRFLSSGYADSIAKEVDAVVAATGD